MTLKKLIFTFILLGLCNMFFGQSSPRNYVLYEVGNTFEDPYSESVFDGISNLCCQSKIAAIAYHIGDDFQESEGVQRMSSFYTPYSFPHTVIDGAIEISGGDLNDGMELTYASYHAERLSTYSSFDISINSIDDDEIEVSLFQTDTYNGSNLKMFVAIVEDAVPSSSVSILLDNVFRDMLPNSQGQDIFSSYYQTQNVEFDFEIDDEWNENNIRLIVFLQDLDTKEILQTEVINYTEEPVIDISILSIDPPNESICNDSLNFSFDLYNSGNIILDSLLFGLVINDMVAYTYTLNDTLFPNELVTIDFYGTPFFLIENSNEIELTVHLPGNNATNTVISFEWNHFIVEPGVFDLSMHTDAYPEDNYWEIRDFNGGVIATNEDLEAYTNYQDSILIEDVGCYLFSMIDSYGDGLLNYGYFNLTSPNGEIISSDNNEDFTVKFASFEVSNQTNISETLSKTINVFPNPVINRIQLSEGLNFDFYEIKNISGQSKSNGKIDNSTINFDLANGVYFLHLDNKIVTRFIVSH